MNKTAESLLIVTYVNEEKFPGVLKKYEGMLVGLKSHMHVKHINISKLSIIGLFKFCTTLVISKDRNLLVRIPTHLMFITAVSIVLARLRGKIILSEFPTPLNAVRNEMTSAQPIKFRVLINLPLFYVGACIINITSSKILQYGYDLSFLQKLAGKRQKIISNGVSTEAINAAYIDEWKPEPSTTHMIMVASFSFWHGADRLIHALRRCRSTVVIHLVGDGAVMGDLKKLVGELNLSDSVLFYGMRDQKFLQTLYQKMDIGVSTLGNYRVNLEQSSVLKTREYIANGLPVLLGYNDIELSGHNYDFLFHVENNENIFDLDEIVDWYRIKHATRLSKKRIVKFAEQQLTFDRKAMEIFY